MNALLPLPRQGALDGRAVPLSPDATLTVSGHPGLLTRVLPPLDALARRARGIGLAASAPGRPGTSSLGSASTARLGLRFEVVDENRLDGLPAALGQAPCAAGAFDERYELEVDGAGATVRAASAAGAFRGAAVLLQALDASDGIRVPSGRIRDAPLLAWRGLSLDVARHFVDVDDVKRVIDLLAWHRLNVLHLHLTDTQAWRLESERWPLLTATGAPFYSRDEWRELVRFADERFVTIVPELDMPGHVGAALAAYPELAEGAEFAHPRLGYLDPHVPATVRFASDVLDEVTELSTSAFVHLGGDEAFGMPEPAYARFVAEVVEHVHGIPRRVIGWQEATRADALSSTRLAGPDLVQLWISAKDAFDAEAVKARTSAEYHALVDQAAKTAALAPQDGPRAVAAGIPLILSPSSPLYLNRGYAEPSADPAQTDAGVRLGFPDYAPENTAALADWDPFAWVAENVPGAAIAGVEAAIWGETVESFDDLALLLLPRLAVVAERAWSPAVSPWESVAARLRCNDEVWARMGFGAWYRSVEVMQGRRRPTVWDHS